MALQIYNVGCMYPYIDYTPRTLQQIMDGYERWQKECKIVSLSEKVFRILSLLEAVFQKFFHIL